MGAISADHQTNGFASVDTIDSPSGCTVRSPAGARGSCWYAVETDQEDLVSPFPRTEKAMGGDADADSPAFVSYRRKRKISAAASENFEIRFLELLEFKETHGHTRVPRRHGKLGDWVNKLRQRKDRLDEQRLGRLNEIDFCWDASDDKRRKEKEKWWDRLESLRKIQPLGVASRQSPVLTSDNLTNSEKKWLRRQQIQYTDSGRKPSLKLDETQIQALNKIDPKWWQSPTERNWNAQYSALRAFRAKHGHTNVTSAHKDKKLFNWVQNTRKKYKAIKLERNDGFRSDGTPKLTTAQIELLDRIGFDWDPWGHFDDFS